MKTFANATAALRRKLGPKIVRTDVATLTAASYDSSKLPFMPEAVIMPAKEADIGVALLLANKHGVPVTTRGAERLSPAAAAPRLGGWVIDMLGLNKIEINEDAGMAHVQCGAKVADIQRAAEAKGWFYPPDPVVEGILHDRRQHRVQRRRHARRQIRRDAGFHRGLAGFLPTGDYVEWGTATKKFSAGFNMRDLRIGSEGMLGVVTGAVLKLDPQPAERWTLLTSFPDETSALEAALALFRSRVQPAICEFLDRESVLCAERANEAECS